jgi:hypothetical protein
MHSLPALAIALFVAACSAQGSRPAEPLEARPAPSATASAGSSSALPPAAPPAVAADPPLGQAGYSPVNPGQLVESLALLSQPPSTSGAPTWRELDHRELALGGAVMVLARLELAGSGAALVILRPERGGFRVVNTYGVEHDGLGATITIGPARAAPDRRSLFVVAHVTRESRGYNAVPGDESSYVEPSAQHSWLAIGIAADRAWRASPELTEYSSVTLVDHDQSLALLACGRGPGTELFPLAASTATFDAPRPDPRPCPKDQ